MRRISKKFSPKDNVTYQYRKMFFRKMPKGFLLKYWMYDEEAKEYYGVLRKPSIVLEIMAIVSLIASITVFLLLSDRNEILVEIPKQMYCINNQLEVNIRNSSDRQVRFSIRYEGKDLLEYYELQPGHSIGTIKVDAFNLGAKSVQAKIVIQSFNSLGRIVEKEEYVLINNMAE